MYRANLFGRGIRLSVVAFVLSAIATAGPVLAGESGKWKGKAVLVITSTKEAKIPDQTGHSVSMTEFDGIIFNEDGKPFLDKARYQVVDLYDTGGLITGGYKTFTVDEGSQVVAKYEVLGGNHPTYNGTWTFIAGTGKFKGITGNGKFDITWTSNTTAWDVLEGEYTLP